MCHHTVGFESWVNFETWVPVHIGWLMLYEREKSQRNSFCFYPPLPTSCLMVLRPDGSHFPNVHILTSWCWNTRFAFSLTVPPTTHFHCVFWPLCAADLVTWTFLLCVQAEGILKQNALQHVCFVLFGGTVSYLSLYFAQHSGLFLCSRYSLLTCFMREAIFQF